MEWYTLEALNLDEFNAIFFCRHKYGSQHSAENHHHLQFTSVCQAETSKAFICSSGNGTTGKISNARWSLLKLNRCEWFKSPIICHYKGVTEAVRLPLPSLGPTPLPLSSRRNIWGLLRENNLHGEVITESQRDFTAFLIHRIRRQTVEVNDSDRLHWRCCPQVLFLISNMLS